MVQIMLISVISHQTNGIFQHTGSHIRPVDQGSPQFLPELSQFHLKLSHDRSVHGIHHSADALHFRAKTLISRIQSGNAALQPGNIFLRMFPGAVIKRGYEAASTLAADVGMTTTSPNVWLSVLIYIMPPYSSAMFLMLLIPKP